MIHKTTRTDIHKLIKNDIISKFNQQSVNIRLAIEDVQNEVSRT